MKAHSKDSMWQCSPLKEPNKVFFFLFVIVQAPVLCASREEGGLHNQSLVVLRCSCLCTVRVLFASRVQGGLYNLSLVARDMVVSALFVSSALVAHKVGFETNF